MYIWCFGNGFMCFEFFLFFCSFCVFFNFCNNFIIGLLGFDFILIELGFWNLVLFSFVVCRWVFLIFGKGVGGWSGWVLNLVVVVDRLGVELEFRCVVCLE